MAARNLRHRLLGNTAVRTVLSMWAWFVLGVVVIVWVPMVAAVRLVTAPFDKGRYAAGYLFRKMTVVHQWLNPLWRFRTSGVKITDPRRPYIVVANHQSFVDILLISQLPWEMKWLSKADFFKYPLVGWLMRMAGDIKLIRGKRGLDHCGDGLVQGPLVEACQRDDLPGGHAQQRRRTAASSKTVRSVWRSRPARPFFRWCSMAPIPLCRKATGDSVWPTPKCA